MHTDGTRGVRNGHGCGGLSGRRAGGQRSTQGALVRLTGTHYLQVQTKSRILSCDTSVVTLAMEGDQVL
jgi:hypothetical protein